MSSKTVKKKQKRKAKLAAERPRTTLGLRAALDSLSKGVQEAFGRTEGLRRDTNDMFDDLNTRLSFVEAHLGLTGAVYEDEEKNKEDEDGSGSNK